MSSSAGTRCHVQNESLYSTFWGCDTAAPANFFRDG
jgi:hypothetical protein